MKLAVSNIAWTAADDDAAYAMLRELGVQHLEIAPTRFWPDLTQVTESQARAVSADLAGKGLTVCAFQALLFGKPELQLFGADNGRALIDYTKQVCRIASWMGARALVFGSPKNRLRGELDEAAALDHACTAFREIGNFASEHGVHLCLEANPRAYGADFMTTVFEAEAVVRAINSPGIRLNFDMGEIIMNDEQIDEALTLALPVTEHFHISEPLLEPFDASRAIHRAAAAQLRSLGYNRLISVEMKTPAAGLPVVRRAIESIQQIYAP